MQLVPPGVGTTNQNAQEVNLTDVATINSTGNPLPAGRSRSTARSPRTRAINRTYYRSLQGMRVRLPEGIATGGGTTKFRDLFLEPGTTAQRLFRKNDAGGGDDAVVGRARRDRRVARRRRRQPGRSAPAVALADADRPRPVRRHAQRRRPADVQLQLLQGHAAAAGAGLNDGEQPTIERGPINAAAPPTAPAQPANSIRVASFNVENLFPVGKVNDGHVITQPEYDERVHAIVQAIRHRLREPDVVAVQEVAVFADGANALTGLAAALGNYTGYIATNNDGRGIATGFLVKNGTTATNGRLIGKDAPSPWGSSTVCDLHPGPLFDRAPYALDLQKGDLSFTAMSNHWASQSHETACRTEEAKYVREQAADAAAAGPQRARGGRPERLRVLDAAGRR